MRTDSIISLTTMVTGFFVGGVLLFGGNELPQGSTLSSGNDDIVGICHYTGSENNPYEYIEVPSSAATEHLDHHNDIFGVNSASDCPTTEVEPTSMSESTGTPVILTQTPQPTEVDLSPTVEFTDTPVISVTDTPILATLTNTPDSTPIISPTSASPTTGTAGDTATLTSTATTQPPTSEPPKPTRTSGPGPVNTPTSITPLTPMPLTPSHVATFTFTHIAPISTETPLVNITEPPRTSEITPVINPTNTPLLPTTPSIEEQILAEIKDQSARIKVLIINSSLLGQQFSLLGQEISLQNFLGIISLIPAVLTACLTAFQKFPRLLPFWFNVPSLINRKVKVARGDFALFVIRVQPYSLWSLILINKSKRRDWGLQPIDDEGIIQWRWRVPRNATLGIRRVVITCSPDNEKTIVSLFLRLRLRIANFLLEKMGKPILLATPKKTKESVWEFEIVEK